jgi:hypothetical protein
VRVPIFYRWAKRDVGKIEENGGSRLPPESRLCSCGWWRRLDGTDYLGVGMKKKTRWENCEDGGTKVRGSYLLASNVVESWASNVDEDEDEDEDMTARARLYVYDEEIATSGGEGCEGCSGVEGGGVGREDGGLEGAWAPWAAAFGGYFGASVEKWGHKWAQSRAGLCYARAEDTNTPRKGAAKAQQPPRQEGQTGSNHADQQPKRKRAKSKSSGAAGRAAGLSAGRAAGLSAGLLGC